MDIINLKKSISKYIGKYKYVWIVLMAGMVLMAIPEREAVSVNNNETESVVKQEADLEQKLERILRNVDGAGEVDVMLAVSRGEEIIYQMDHSDSYNGEHSDSRQQTILITDSNRNQSGLIHQKIPPVYQGAIILTQGADDPVVKLAIVQAVADVTGLGADKISVLKKR